MQLALLLLATIEGIGAARGLDRLAERHLAYRWLCCGAAVTVYVPLPEEKEGIKPETWSLARRSEPMNRKR